MTYKQFIPMFTIWGSRKPDIQSRHILNCFIMLNFAQVEVLPINRIDYVKGNREINNSHKEKMKSLIQDYGFADTIKVIKNGRRYYALEGQHRLQALTELGADKVPCSVVDWLDSEDFEDVQRFIIDLNAHNKVWSLYDYVKSFADNGIKEYQHLRKKMIDYQKIVSNGVVATIYDGVERGHRQLKEGNLRFVNQQLSDHIVEEFSNMIAKWGKKNLPAQSLRKAATLLLKSEDPYGYLNAFKYAVTNQLTSVKEPVPDGDESFTYWFNNVVVDTYALMRKIR